MSATTASTRSLPRASVARRIGIALCILLAVLDFAGIVMFANAPMPVEIGFLIGAFTVATLVGGTAAWYGARWGVWLTVITRVLSALMIVPQLLAPDAPHDLGSLSLSIGQAAVTVLAIALMVARRR